MKVFRCQVSKYQAPTYVQQEAESISQLGFQYLSPTTAIRETPDIVITNSNTDLTKFNFDLNKIKLLIHPNSGHDNIDDQTIKSLGGPAILGNPIRAKAVTNYTLSCFFKALHSPPFIRQWDATRKWSRKSAEEINILIIGYGHIGKLLHSSLQALYPNIYIYDPYENAPANQQLGNLADTDVILLVPSLTRSSYHMINQQFLQQLKPEVVIINGARGQLIEQNALINFLQQNPKAQAYIDVFEQEPADLSPWQHIPNAFLTSHIAGVFSKLDQVMLNFIIEVLTNFKQLPLEKFIQKYSPLYLQDKIIKIPPLK